MRRERGEKEIAKKPTSFVFPAAPGYSQSMSIPSKPYVSRAVERVSTKAEMASSEATR